MPKIDQDRTSVFVIEDPGKTWTLTRDTTIRIAGSGSGIYEPGTPTGSKLVIQGGIIMDTSTSPAVDVDSMGSFVHVARTGTISGEIGVRTNGNVASILNEGTIVSELSCLTVTGLGSTVTNAGTLIGDQFGVTLYESQATFVNEKSGSVVAGSAVVVTGVAFAAAKIVNHGYIFGENYAISGGTGVETVINRGHIDGQIRLGGGDDHFDTKGGTVSGSVSGGLGDDTYIISDGSLAIVENAGEGWDWVRSSFSFALQDNIEHLTLTGAKNLNGVASATGSTVKGNSGNNILVGQGATDQLDGGRGKDRLTGGGDTDYFMFLKGYGADTIVDFRDGDDLLNILGFKNADSYSELKRLMSQHGDDVWITFGSGDKLILKDTEKSDLLEDHFTFAV